MYNFLDMQPHVIKKNYQKNFECAISNQRSQILDFRTYVHLVLGDMIFNAISSSQSPLSDVSQSPLV